MNLDSMFETLKSIFEALKSLFSGLFSIIESFIGGEINIIPEEPSVERETEA